MAKNFLTIYERTGDSIALNQQFFAKLEAVKGTLIGPTDTDFFFTRSGGSITHTQPKNPSEHRSGRHNNDTLAEKKVTEWSIPTYVNIDTLLGAAATAEVDDAIRLLWKSLLGFEDTATSAVYDSSVDPDITFSLFENGDKWAHQANGAAVEASTLSLPGDGQSGLEWSGRAADRKRVGIGRFTTSSDATNIITLDAATEAKRFPVGSMVMIIEDDGLVRSADTPNGTYRVVTLSDSGTGAITVDGAVLADADGTTGAGFFLAYAEPETPTAISDIQTGLVGSAAIVGLSATCVRSATVTMTNNHEWVDYCFGTDALATPYFVPGSRLMVEVELEMNLNDALIEFLDDLESFTSKDVDLVLGDSTGRHLKVDLPKVVFDVPSVTVPDEGSIPVSFSGIGLQTALDAADEITVSYL